MESAMKNSTVLGSAIAVLLLAACDGSSPEASPVAVSSEEVAKQEAELAEIERIKQLDDPEELFKILSKKEIWMSDVWKAADAQLAKVLEDDFAAAKNTYELAKFKDLTRVPMSQLDGMYIKREKELKK